MEMKQRDININSKTSFASAKKRRRILDDDDGDDDK